ncbi:MAG: 3-hydroxyacyl-ACP dehydratase FabZ family protein [Gemmataceae bacterium]
MPPPAHLNLEEIDWNHILADQEAIRAVNPQRFEMEQLTAIVLLDPARQLIAGYKEVRPEEFWVRGHLPDFPLLPGVLMCEAAAQLSGYYGRTQHVMGGDFIGFGGLENVRFRGIVRPGDRLLLIGKGLRLHRRQTLFNVQGFVGDNMVFHADVIGVPLHKE